MLSVLISNMVISAILPFQSWQIKYKHIYTEKFLHLWVRTHKHHEIKNDYFSWP